MILYSRIYSIMSDKYTEGILLFSWGEENDFSHPQSKEEKRKGKRRRIFYGSIVPRDNVMLVQAPLSPPIG